MLNFKQRLQIFTIEKYDTECYNNDHECLSRFWLISEFRYTLFNYNFIITFSVFVSKMSKRKIKYNKLCELEVNWFQACPSHQTIFSQWKWDWANKSCNQQTSCIQVDRERRTISV